mgnify:CR=1 FL=1
MGASKSVEVKSSIDSEYCCGGSLAAFSSTLKIFAPKQDDGLATRPRIGHL